MLNGAPIRHEKKPNVTLTLTTANTRYGAKKRPTTGQEYAKAWEPGKTLPTFPSDQDNHDFYEGYETGWWERGNDDCRFNRSKRTDFPDNKAKLAYLDGWADEEEC